ncbi:hypothetical protein ACLK19_03890 [Escherichia coli]
MSSKPSLTLRSGVGGRCGERVSGGYPSRSALAQYGISLAEEKSALHASNQEVGGSSIEPAEAE